jgi:AraC-like DNA-binding protein
VAAVHSKLSVNVRDVPSLFEYTRQAIRFRDLDAVNQMININEMIHTGTEKVDYPFALEKEILKTVRVGSREEAKTYMAEFMLELQQKVGKEALLLQGALQLLGNILNSILQSGHNPSKIYDGINLYEELLQLHEPKEMLIWFDTKVFMPYMTAWMESQDIRLKQIVENVIISLEQTYMKEISVESCAEMHGMHSSTLSKIFKKVTGVTFLDFLTDLRLTKAKELLANTNLRISDIAERVGYQITYFNRVFKKYENMTPGQYRDNMEKKDIEAQ